MSQYDYDLFVIGAGSGGVRAARMSAAFCARVGIAEEYRIGGTCVIRGCVPKKLLVYASHFSEDFEDAAGFGWTAGEPEFSWQRLIENKDQEIGRLSGLYRQTLEQHDVDIFESRARLTDAHTVDLGDKTVTAETILISTGGTPYLPHIDGIEHAITSNDAFHLTELPQRIVIAGGGYIAVEFAGIFAGLGADVTLVYRRDMILRGFDDDLRHRLTELMEARGIRIVTQANVDRITKTDGGLDAHLTNDETLSVDQVMFAVGRRPNTRDIGLELVGVETTANGAICVDDHSRTNIDNIYAVGDVTDRIALTPVAIKEGHAFALTRYKDTPTAPDHRDVPSAVFSQPPIATVGLTETEAMDKLGEVYCYTSDFRPMRHTLGGRDERAFIKVLVDPDTDRVVGAHMIGPDAPEIIQGIAVGIKCHMTKAQLDSTVAIHPTSAEEFVLLSKRRTA